MQILNLDKAFAPFGAGTISYKSFMFPSGVEVGFRIESQIVHDEPVLITARLTSSDDLMVLLNATDALRRFEIEDIHLFLPFVPYARQDRVAVSGEAFSLDVFARIINAQGYKSVRIFDPHSDVTPALIHRSVILRNHKFVKMALDDMENFQIVSPDAGAYKKIFAVCDEIGYDGYVAICNKIRIAAGGDISHISVDVSDFGGQDVVIIDDICDGGATFVKLATELKKRNVARIHLVVSHGIFSKGVEELLRNGIDTIIVTDSFNTIDTVSDRVKQIALADILSGDAWWK